MPDWEEEVDQIEVPECDCPLSLDYYDDPECSISPSAASSNYGIDLYASAVAFVEAKMTHYM